MVCGSRCICIRQIPHARCRATTSTAPDWRRAHTSLMMSAPRSSACCITSALQVSTDTARPGAPLPAAPATPSPVHHQAPLADCRAARGFTANVQNVRAIVHQLLTMAHCQAGPAMAASIRKQIRRDVHNAHILGRDRSIAKRVVCQIMQESENQKRGHLGSRIHPGRSGHGRCWITATAGVPPAGPSPPEEGVRGVQSFGWARRLACHDVVELVAVDGFPIRAWPWPWRASCPGSPRSDCAPTHTARR